MLEAHIKWIFFNVVMALFPLLLNFILTRVGNMQIGLVDLLKDGELFFFSTAISASAIGTLFSERPSDLATAVVLGCLLLVILIISTGLFSLRSFLKLKQMDVLDARIFGKASVWCSLIAVILSYLTFVQGGMK